MNCTKRPEPLALLAAVWGSRRAYLTLALLFCVCLVALSCSSDDTAGPAPLATPPAEGAVFQLPAPAGVNAAGEQLSLEVVDSDATPGLITDYRGFAAYGIQGETAASLVCVDACTNTWVPLEPRDNAISDRLDLSLYEVATRPDGTAQVVYGGIPLYLWTGDTDIGIPRGVGVAGIWFALTA